MNELTEHKLIKPTDPHPKWHREGHCPICDGGLGICSVCGKAESELDQPCQPSQDKREEVAKILKAALIKAYNNGRAGNQYIPEEVMPTLLKELDYG